MINHSMFQRNGRAGYVLKPQALREPNKELLSSLTNHMLDIRVRLPQLDTSSRKLIAPSRRSSQPNSSQGERTGKGARSSTTPSLTPTSKSPSTSPTGPVHPCLQRPSHPPPHPPPNSTKNSPPRCSPPSLPLSPPPLMPPPLPAAYRRSPQPARP